MVWMADPELRKKWLLKTSAFAFERGLNDSWCSGLRRKRAIINVASADNKLPENWKVDKWPVITHLAALIRRYCAKRINDVASLSQSLSTKENLPGSSVSKAWPPSSGSLGSRRCTILPWIKLAPEEITSLVNAVHQPRHIHPPPLDDTGAGGQAAKQGQPRSKTVKK